jgi:glycosyltransferase involved in cell wall biosynthesis
VFAAQLSDALAGLGHEVMLVGLYPAPADALTPASVPTHDLSGRPGAVLSYGLVAELRDLIGTMRPDVVQANGSSTLKYASLAKTISRGSWSLVYRNIGIASHWLRYPAHRWWSRWLLRKVGHVAAVSRHSGEDFQRTFGLPASRISTIPVGVHVPAVPRQPELRQRLLDVAGMGAAAEILIHVGSFTPEKNHLWLVDAFARLCARRPLAHLVLIGGGPLRSLVEESVQAKRLEDRVHFVGTRPDVPEIVGGADLLVLSSTTEGISGVILEAAAQGVPTVSTDVGSIAEAVDHGRTGLLVAPSDQEGFVGAIDDLLEDPDRRRAMGDAAHTYVKDRYHMDRIVADFENLYTRLANGGR